jgi:hypothetical protein
VRPRRINEARWNAGYAGETHWTPVLTALDARLSEPEWQNADVRVVIADNWVRYAMVPYSDDLSGEAERMTFARHVLTGIFGDVVAQWTLSLSDTLPGRNQVACAMPSALLDELREILQRHGLQLRSLQPQLVSAYNYWRSSLPDGGAWFVSLEQGTLAAARLGKGGWDRVHSVRIGADWAVELRRLQTFGRLASSAAQEGRVYVDAPAALRAASEQSVTDLVWLDDAAAAESGGNRLEYLRRNQG